MTLDLREELFEPDTDSALDSALGPIDSVLRERFGFRLTRERVPGESLGDLYVLFAQSSHASQRIGTAYYDPEIDQAPRVYVTQPQIRRALDG